MAAKVDDIRKECDLTGELSQRWINTPDFHVLKLYDWLPVFVYGSLKQGEHIRVTLIIGKLAGGARRGLEIWALSVSVLLAGLLTWFAWRLAWQSHQFNDISTSADATALWIPQILMGTGTTVLLIALIDEWVLEWRGQRARVDGDSRHE